MQHEVAEVLFKGTLEDRREGSGVRSLLHRSGGGSSGEDLGKERSQSRPHCQRSDAWRTSAERRDNAMAQPPVT